MNKELLKVSLRQRAFYLPGVAPVAEATPTTLSLVAELHQMGFAPDEPLLHALNGLDDGDRQDVLDVINDVMGTRLNWASLVKGWLAPTGETRWDHFVTYVANAIRAANPEADIPGTTLPCGHFIPDGTFPLERYNGCPFCGTPFRLADDVNRGQGSRLKVLTLWGDADLDRLTGSLLQSPVPLDATQREQLRVLLRYRPLPPEVTVAMRETRMLVVDVLVEQGRDDEAAHWMDSPADVMRYLWYRHTGHVQLLEPRTIVNSARKNQRHWGQTDDAGREAVDGVAQRLLLKYTRPWCRRVARWLNALPMPLDEQLEAMHAKREMWVRFIRALRLAEYARREEYGQLRTLLDRFYRADYDVWKGRLDALRLKGEAGPVLQMLQQRPGFFARSLFSTMLQFGPEPVLEAFGGVSGQVAPRLLLTLGAQAQLWFDRRQARVARPLSGVMKQVEPHRLLMRYTDAELEGMKQRVAQLYLEAMKRRFAQSVASGVHPSTIYIDPQLDSIPVSVGDRSATVQDASAALQGQRFPVGGDAVRLFLQWGKGLPAQHLDMDLSCYLLTDEEAEVCAYFNLSPEGARHSGDIQHIPDLVGTAEYIELQLPLLQQRGVRRVVFTCNAYTAGELQPGLLVGWMSAECPMAVSEETGVAYDPSTVDHMVRITEPNLSKGLIFGVLDVEHREVTWLEMAFDGQTVLSISPQTVDAYLRRLAAKPTIGQVLRLKAEAQHLVAVDTPDAADEAYTLLWAQNPAAVSALLLA
ncbi:MAG: hypothetical protein IJV24_06435 [Prevotella sp.]|nr:hypothetical protein [Prevotella sp.]